ncbi:hypothetical protein DM02DRAFT_155986 [Periconia macrospinosa]|uniref:Uncharacterized protein n=1 Tax=Periconia macrospinosa TaxID=97972 RepID=A0A2V1EDV1_9PLEO|nr:hypothetical protein DM02DRAFT_155986 [Periconia macrospinosa]
MLVPQPRETTPTLPPPSPADDIALISPPPTSTSTSASLAHRAPSTIHCPLSIVKRAWPRSDCLPLTTDCQRHPRPPSPHGHPILSSSPLAHVAHYSDLVVTIQVLHPHIHLGALSARLPSKSRGTDPPSFRLDPRTSLPVLLRDKV